MRCRCSQNGLEAIRLISDWAKWLITIETAAIAITGALLTADDGARVSDAARLLGTAALASFFVSIAGAAVLLLTLPEIAQYFDDEVNVWLTRDSVAGRIMRLNTQTLALVESIFFGIGLVLVIAMLMIDTWS